MLFALMIMMMINRCLNCQIVTCFCLKHLWKMILQLHLNVVRAINIRIALNQKQLLNDFVPMHTEKSTSNISIIVHIILFISHKIVSVTGILKHFLYICNVSVYLFEKNSAIVSSHIHFCVNLSIRKMYGNCFALALVYSAQLLIMLHAFQLREKRSCGREWLWSKCCAFEFSTGE